MAALGRGRCHMWLPIGDALSAMRRRESCRGTVEVVLRSPPPHQGGRFFSTHPQPPMLGLRTQVKLPGPFTLWWFQSLAGPTPLDSLHQSQRPRLQVGPESTLLPPQDLLERCSSPDAHCPAFLQPDLFAGKGLGAKGPSQIGTRCWGQAHQDKKPAKPDTWSRSCTSTCGFMYDK